VFITGIGVVLPGAVGNEAFVRRLTSGADPLGGEVPDADIAPLLNARRVRRMSQYVKLSLAATVLCLRDAGITDVPAFAQTCAAILGTTLGSTNYCEQYYGLIVREGVTAANPMLFAEGVPNAAAAHLSLMLSLKGPCQTIIGTLTAGLDALRLAAARIATGACDRAIVGAAEEFTPTLYYANAACGASELGGAVIGAGAVTFLLESRASMESHGGRPRARIARAATRMCRGGAAGIEQGLADAIRQIGAPAGRVGTALHASGLRGAESARAAGPERHAAVAECFSAGAMVELAAALLTGRLPGGSNAKPAFAAAATDPSGGVVAIAVEPMGE
jgi:3-oxoacyl-[acyl-carrier-protein] synthase II